MDREGIYYSTDPQFSAEMTTAKNGSPKIVVKVSLTHWWEAREKKWEPLESPIERKLDWSLSGGAVPYTADKLRAIGFNMIFEAPAFNRVDVRPLRFVNKHNEYNGKVSDRYDLELKGGGQRRAAPSREVLADLTRQLGGNAAPQGNDEHAPPDAPGEELGNRF